MVGNELAFHGSLGFSEKMISMEEAWARASLLVFEQEAGRSGHESRRCYYLSGQRSRRSILQVLLISKRLCKSPEVSQRRYFPELDPALLPIAVLLRISRLDWSQSRFRITWSFFQRCGRPGICRYDNVE